MSIDLPSNATPDGVNVHLPDELSIATVAEVYRSLRPALEQADSLILDLSAVDEIDTAGLQLLMSLKAGARARSQKLVYRNHSRAVLRLLSLSGTAGFLGDRLVIGAGERAEFPFAYGTRRAGGQS